MKQAVLALASLWLVALGCGGGSGAGDGSSGGRGGGDAAAEASTDTGSGGGGGSLDAGMEMPSDTDAGDGCWPPCISNLRMKCPRPASATCTAQTGPDHVNYCYSTGVKQTVTTTDGGLLSYAYTQTDGEMLCFYMLLDPAANPPVFSYYDNQGRFVGTVTAVMPSSTATDYVVDCQGTQTTVTVAQQQRPECRMVSERDCVAGGCP